MQKLVIVTSDLLRGKELINQCIGEVHSLQIIGIFTSLEELENFKKKSKFDYLLFDNFADAEYGKTDYIIISIDNFKTPVKRYENRISLSNALSYKDMSKRLKKFTHKVSADSIRQKSTEILFKLGFSFKHIGSKYLVDAICYSYINDCDSSFENLEKDIYPYIAKINHTQVENVKWSVTRTINLMYLNHTTKSIKVLEDYFCLDHLEKPTPKLVIGVIKNKLISNIPSKL